VMQRSEPKEKGPKEKGEAPEGASPNSVSRLAAKTYEKVFEVRQPVA